MKKREALLIMLEQWDYMALNNCRKICAISRLSLPKDMKFQCSCCEHTGHEGDWQGRNCYKCPIDWPGLKRFNSILPCHKSYFKAWEVSRRNETTPLSKRYASKIANLALNALNKEWPEEA